MKVEHQRTDAFELWCWRRLLSPLDCQEIKPVHPKGNQSWIFIERTDAEAEAPILWPPDAKSWIIGKDPDAGLFQRQKDAENLFQRLKAGREGDDREQGVWIGITDSMDKPLS